MYQVKLQYEQEQTASTSSTGSLRRQKVVVHRQKLLECAIRIGELYGKDKAVLEIEFQEEVGHGLGPTTEFYSLVCKEFQKSSLHLWRSNEGEYAFAERGLFPAPLVTLSPDLKQQVKRSMVGLGRFIGKAMQDNRLLDLPLSLALCKILTEEPLQINDLCDVDPILGRSVIQLVDYSKRQREILEDGSLSTEEKTIALESFCLQGGSKIEDLCLNFTVPGIDSLELVENGSSISVTDENVFEYVQLVTRALLVETVQESIGCLVSGLSDVINPKCLRTFSALELQSILQAKDDEPWEVSSLVEHFEFDHGYTARSTVIQNLLTVLCTLNKEQRRQFLLFVTGSPRLPIRGFMALSPKLKIHRKEPSQGYSSDEHLPSCNTCFHILKVSLGGIWGSILFFFLFSFTYFLSFPITAS